jgi:hypothetical protein
MSSLFGPFLKKSGTAENKVGQSPARIKDRKELRDGL